MAVGSRFGGWARRYPPVALIVGALLLAVFTLPSALNLPVANPGQTLEYAPVPGDQGTAPPGGNAAALGVGNSGTGPGTGTGGGGGGGALAPPPPPLLNQGGTPPSQKQCVGTPPRQTDDPLAPPCVGYFNGDNGGATYTGVTKDEVTVVFYFALPNGSGDCESGTSEGCSANPPTGMYDMDKPSDYGQFLFFRFLHDWSVYFNFRYQTYNRHVHFWAYNNGGVPTDRVAAAQADAASNWNSKHPFADQVTDAQFTDPLSYERYMAAHATVSFGSANFVMNPESLYQSYPGLFWGFQPPIELWAQMYSSYVCSKVKPNTVSNSTTYATGTPRQYGLLYTTDDSWPDVKRFGTVVQQQLRACGIDIVATHSFPHAGINYTSGDEGIATQNMADFEKQGVTTILMADGVESNDARAADALHYYPEWMVAGTTGVDGNFDGSAMPAAEWTNAWVVAPTTLQNADGNPVEPSCYNAIEEVDPNISRTSLDMSYACLLFFDNIRQMFIGIQVAGPKLTPQNMNEGFHAIPAKPSTDPTTPSCYYNANDYTCVKDAVAEWWDPNGHPASTGGAAGATNGCYRMWLNGRRFRVGEWPSGNVPGTVAEGKDPNDICNLFQGGLSALVTSPGG